MVPQNNSPNTKIKSAWPTHVFSCFSSILFSAFDRNVFWLHSNELNFEIRILLLHLRATPNLHSSNPLPQHTCPSITSHTPLLHCGASTLYWNAFIIYHWVSSISSIYTQLSPKCLLVTDDLIVVIYDIRLLFSSYNF